MRTHAHSADGGAPAGLDAVFAFRASRSHAGSLLCPGARCPSGRRRQVLWRSGRPEFAEGQTPTAVGWGEEFAELGGPRREGTGLALPAAGSQLLPHPLLPPPPKNQNQMEIEAGRRAGPTAREGAPIVVGGGAGKEAGRAPFRRGAGGGLCVSSGHPGADPEPPRKSLRVLESSVGAPWALRIVMKAVSSAQQVCVSALAPPPPGPAGR